MSTRPPVCVSASDYHVELVYARAHDDTDQYSTQATALRNAFEIANAVLNQTAIETGATNADYKVTCSGGVETVANAVLPTSKNSDTFDSVFSDVYNAGYNKSKTKYVVFYDEIIMSGYAGMADGSTDDRLVADNFVMTRAAMAAVVTDLSYLNVMHELSHAMGAVENSAPHSTKALHCYDGYDVMCYNDGGSQGSLYSGDTCPDMHHFDCSYDDYFNVNPAPGSYLSGHWNLGSRYNQYIRFLPDVPPSPTPSATPTPSQTPSPAYDTTPPVIKVALPKPGVRYNDGCGGTTQASSSTRAQYHNKGCVRANAPDDSSGTDFLKIYFDGELIATVTQFPMAPLMFPLSQGPGSTIKLRFIAIDFAGNIAQKNISVDIV